MNRRDLFRLAGAVAVAPRAMLAAPAAPVVPQFMSGIAIRMEMERFGLSRVGPGDYFFSGYAALMSSMPGRQALVEGLGDEDDDDGA